MTVTVNNSTRVVKIQSTGSQGVAGIHWRQDWTSGAAYLARDGVYLNGSSYRAVVSHVAEAGNEPGVGEAWESAWKLLALGSDVASVAAVAANMADINTVAAREAEINIVAARDADIGTVAGRDADIGAVAAVAADVHAVAANMGAIIDAPNHAADAADAARAAIAAADATGQDRTATGLDRLRTGEDRVATGQDRTATGQDKTQTGLDRTATGFDRQATAADRVQIGLDRAATGGDALSTAADVAVANAAKDAAIAQEILVAGLKAGVDTTYAAMIAALAGVTNYDNTLGQLTGAAKQIVAAADVVAAFVYDTAKDSDGGVWRWRARGSWFYEALNTATRGSRQFFPKRALIVSRSTAASSIVIYDLDDRACPIWKVFKTGSVNDALPVTAGSAPVIDARNGCIFVGFPAALGVVTLDFIKDDARRITNVSGGTGRASGGLANQAGGMMWSYGDANVIVNATVNAVAATVLPGTPIDPVRKLPTPTVAVGTAGGVSVIHWDGRVATGAFGGPDLSVSFAPDGTLWYSGGVGNAAMLFAPPNEYIANAFVARYYTDTSIPALKDRAGTGILVQTRNGTAKGSSAGLNILKSVPASGILANAQSNKSSISYVTSTFSTGDMVGDIKLALAESTADVTTLSPATLINDAFAYADWTAAQAAGWSAWMGTENISIVAGGIHIAANDTASGYRAAQFVVSGLVIGKMYSCAFNFKAKAGNAQPFVSTQYQVFWGPGAGITPGNYVVTFIANATTENFRIGMFTPAAATGADYIEFGNISLKRGVDVRYGNRSISATTGTTAVIVGAAGITRAAVATGAELAAYSNFASNRYLEVPPISAFDFGTGDFSTEMWVYLPATPIFVPLFSYRPTTGATQTAGWTAFLSSTSLNFYSAGNTNSITIPAVTLSAWTKIRVLRRSGVLEVWINGVLAGTLSIATNLSAVGSTLQIGFDHAQGGNPQAAEMLALPRISATAPTPAQIRATDAAEALMFQPGAKCLLTSTDNVQAIDYDAGTDTLYAAKASGGTDVFKGMVRLSSIAMASENTLSAELVTNGQFAADANWAKGTGWAIAAGAATKTPGTASLLEQTGYTLSTAKTYLVEVVVANRTAGVFNIRLGNNTLNSATGIGNGLTSYLITPGNVASQSVSIYGDAAFDGSVKSVSVREVTSVRLSSNNHKGVSVTNDNIAIFTDAEAYVKTPSISLREAVDTAIGRAASPVPYVRNVIERPSCAVTSNATPTVIASFPMDKGEAGDWVIETASREYGDPAAQEFGLFRDHFYAYRPGEGNIALSGTSTQTIIRRVTATQAVTIQVNTTTQCIEVLATGVAAKSLEWGVKAVFFPVAQVA